MAYLVGLVKDKVSVGATTVVALLIPNACPISSTGNLDATLANRRPVDGGYIAIHEPARAISPSGILCTSRCRGSR
jgi:hypothetical protein